MKLKKVFIYSVLLCFSYQNISYSQTASDKKVDFKNSDKTQNEWRYFLNGKDVSYLPDIELDGNTKYIPVDIVRNIGAILTIDYQNRTAYITNNDESFVLKENKKEIYPNNPSYKIQDPPIWKNNTMYVPSNFLLKLNISVGENRLQNELNVLKTFNNISEVKSNFDNIEGKIIFNLDTLPVYETFSGKDFYKITLYGTGIKEFDKIKKQIETISSDFKKIEVENSKQGIINITFYPKLNFENTNVYYLEKPNRLVVQFPKIFHNEVKEYVRQGLNYSRISESNYQGPIRVNLLEINPKSSIILKPVVNRSGNDFILKEVGNTARDFKAIAGVNGGYFSSKTRFPLGLVILNKNLLSAPIYNRTSLLFNKDGSFDIKNVDLNIFIKSTDNQGNSKQLKVNAYNQPPQKNQIVLFTWNYGKDNLNKKKSAPVKTEEETPMVTPEEEQEYSGYLVSSTGDRLEKLSDFNAEIPAGKFVLYASGKGKEDLEKLSQNLSNYEISFNYSENLNNVLHALGGGPRLIKNGAVEITSQQEKFQPDIAQGRAPRTAFALLRNGKIIIITADGRQSDSQGFTLDELAYFLKDYEVRDAINFDGGGSTAMSLNGNVVNTVSDPKERKVSNGLFLFEGQ